MNANATTIGLYKAVAKGDLTAEQAGEQYAEKVRQEEQARKKIAKPRFIPNAVWSVMIILGAALLVPFDRR